MGDWIKLPSGTYINLSSLRVVSDENFFILGIDGPFTWREDRQKDKAVILAALDERSRDADGGLK
jgi:hypothetical protein